MQNSTEESTANIAITANLQPSFRKKRLQIQRSLPPLFPLLSPFIPLFCLLLPFSSSFPSPSPPCSLCPDTSLVLSLSPPPSSSLSPSPLLFFFSIPFACLLTLPCIFKKSLWVSDSFLWLFSVEGGNSVSLGIASPTNLSVPALQGRFSGPHIP